MSYPNQIVKLKHFHPFPARMAPEIVVNSFDKLKKGSIILDPMAGSGTVLRFASYLGYNAIGYDLDPLALLISTVGTTKYNIEKISDLFSLLLNKYQLLQDKSVLLPWIDNDAETTEFINYWFASKQIKSLRILSYLINIDEEIVKHKKELQVIKLALSRLIITKEKRASLARDTSHSRPHKVATENEFEVITNLNLSLNQIIKLLRYYEPIGHVKIKTGDSRNLKEINNGNIDLIVTSPPYLNALDYLRGHKFSLVWFGYTMEGIRKIRSTVIGNERVLNLGLTNDINKIIHSIGEIDKLSTRNQKIIHQYVYDIASFMKECTRVLKNNSKAIFVIGDSFIKDVSIKSSEAIKEAGHIYGLKLKSRYKRTIPTFNRYLPLPNDNSSLSKRMKTEQVLTFYKS